MKKKSKIILGVCIVAAALIGMSVWNTWFSPTKIAFINFQTIQQGSISKANDNSSIKLSEVSLDNLDRLTGYDMVFINGMGLRIVEEQRQQIQQAADKGIPVYTSMATNPANNICNLDSVQQNLIRGYLTNGGKTNYRNMLNYIRKAIDASRPIEINFGDPDVLEATQIAKKVGNERLRVVQFTRFQKAIDGTYFAALEPIYNVLPLPPVK